MKAINYISRNISLGIATLTIASLISFTTPARAEDQVKGAQKLLQLNAIKTVPDVEAVQAGDLVVMSCPKCKNSWVNIVEPATKTGVKPETKIISRHDCPGCQHKFVTEGHGKARTDKLVHICKQCGSEDAFCCVMKKGSGPTVGMEKP